MTLAKMSDKIATIIGTGGILGTLTVEHLNSYAALVIALLTIGILLPKFLAAVPRDVAILRSGFRGFIQRMRNGKDAPPEV